MRKPNTKNTNVHVNCPSCSAKVTWSDAFPHRPFCSERCKNHDFIDWSNEQHRIAGSADFDDVLSDALLEQPPKLH